MRIDGIETWQEDVPLTRPYTIATRTIASVPLFFVRVTSGRQEGFGSASPSLAITGEHAADCAEALDRDHLSWLVGQDPRHLHRLAGELAAQTTATPAARAAVEMALFDLFARQLGVPLVDFLGRLHRSLPTSITIGIKSTNEALEEAEEYLARGFRHLKVKIGHYLEEDLDRLARLREAVGPGIGIRVDGNQGYDLAATRKLLEAAARLDLELVEQPLPRGREQELRQLPDALRLRVAADESLHGVSDALRLTEGSRACGIFNIKLMKCGGISSALVIARVAAAADVDLMWGCNDESEVSIAAALHTALACPRTRFLDLDGSFDLARDPLVGGFVLREGKLEPRQEAGLGVRLRDG